MSSVKNTDDHSIIQDLRESICDDDSILIQAESFSIFAFDILKEQIGKAKEIKLLISDENIKDFFDEDFDIHASKRLESANIALQLIELLKERKIRIKKCERIDSCFIVTKKWAYEFKKDSLNAKNFGFSADENYTDRNHKYSSDEEDYADIKKEFSELWQDRKSLEVNEKIAEGLKKCLFVSPNDAYYFLLKELFNQDVDKNTAANAVSENFQNSKIYNAMFDFQKHAAEDIINRLETLGVCFLSDSVGLGKTFTALGVIKKYLLEGTRVLVLCPKKLENNWRAFMHADKDNFLKERFDYDLLFHTDLGRKGKSWDDRDLENINWDSYGLVVIDESHNFRTGLKTDKTKHVIENRYSFLMSKVVRGEVKSKLLLLSATPVNNRFTDMKNQLELVCTDGICSSILPKGKTLRNVFNKADRDFEKWLKNPDEEKTTRSLVHVLDPVFIKILETISIARSRDHIKKFYGSNSQLNFPKRLPPVSIEKYDECMNASELYEKIAMTLLQWNLSVYSVPSYIRPEHTEKYSSFIKDISNSRIKSDPVKFKKLIRSNVLKRLESSAYSFDKTLEHIEKKTQEAISKIEAFKKNHNEETIEINDDIKIFEEDDDDIILTNQKYKIRLEHLDLDRWYDALKTDLRFIVRLRDYAHGFLVSDAKIKKLKKIIKSKIYSPNPQNGNNKKIIIFTAYSDTAHELYNKLKGFMKEKFNIETALVTGTYQETSLQTGEKMDFNKILTCFSPKSKHKDELYPKIQGEIDLLIATDCISEGQNLQDCDFLINYDIHWNPTRIIQRFGRIDRIGSVNKEIQMVNFWPCEDLNLYIQLKSRVEGRMVATDLSGTALDNPLSADSTGNDFDYRAEQIEKNIKQTALDDDEEKVLLREFTNIKNGNFEASNSFSITDFSSLGFKNEYKNYLSKIRNEKTPDTIETFPKGICTVIKNDNFPKGDIFILKERAAENGIEEKRRQYPFFPFHFVYVSDSEAKVMDSVQMLSVIREACNGNNEVNESYSESLTEAKEYLKRAEDSLVEKEEADVNIDLINGNFTGLDNLLSEDNQKKIELVSYFVLR